MRLEVGVDAGAGVGGVCTTEGCVGRGALVDREAAGCATFVGLSSGCFGGEAEAAGCSPGAEGTARAGDVAGAVLRAGAGSFGVSLGSTAAPGARGSVIRDFGSSRPNKNQSTNSTPTAINSNHGAAARSGFTKGGLRCKRNVSARRGSLGSSGVAASAEGLPSAPCFFVKSSFSGVSGKPFSKISWRSSAETSCVPNFHGSKPGAVLCLVTIGTVVSVSARLRAWGTSGSVVASRFIGWSPLVLMAVPQNTGWRGAGGRPEPGRGPRLSLPFFLMFASSERRRWSILSMSRLVTLLDLAGAGLLVVAGAGAAATDAACSGVVAAAGAAWAVGVCVTDVASTTALAAGAGSGGGCVAAGLAASCAVVEAATFAGARGTAEGCFRTRYTAARPKIRMPAASPQSSGTIGRLLSGSSMGASGVARR